VLLFKSFSVCSENKGKIILQKSKISLKQIGAFCKISQKFSEKKKRKKIRKGIKGPGDRIQPAIEGSPRPTSLPPRTFTPFSLSVTDTWTPLVIPPKQTGANTAHPERDLHGFFSDSVRTLAPLPHNAPHINPLHPHSPLPKTLAYRRQAALNQRRCAAATARGRRGILVSLDPLPIILLHVLFHLNQVHLSDMVSLFLAHQDVDSVRV
jgi:hypothetical protein